MDELILTVGLLAAMWAASRTPSNEYRLTYDLTEFGGTSHVVYGDAYEIDYAPSAEFGATLSINGVLYDIDFEAIEEMVDAWEKGQPNG